MAVTVKVPAVPSVKVVVVAEVMAGAASTVRVKVWVASGPTPLEAVMVIGKRPGRPSGCPTAAPLPCVEGHPGGQGPGLGEGRGRGSRWWSRVKVPAEPSVKVVVAAEVMAGAGRTVRVKLWVASGRPRWWR